MLKIAWTRSSSSNQFNSPVHGSASHNFVIETVQTQCIVPNTNTGVIWFDFKAFNFSTKTCDQTALNKIHNQCRSVLSCIGHLSKPLGVVRSFWVCLCVDVCGVSDFDVSKGCFWVYPDLSQPPTTHYQDLAKNTKNHMTHFLGALGLLLSYKAQSASEEKNPLLNGL